MCNCDYDQQMGQIPASEFSLDYMADPFPIFEPAPAPIRESPFAGSPVRPTRDIVVPIRDSPFVESPVRPARDIAPRPDVVLPFYFEESQQSAGGLGIIPIAVIGLVLLALFKGGR